MAEIKYVLTIGLKNKLPLKSYYKDKALREILVSHVKSSVIEKVEALNTDNILDYADEKKDTK